MEKTLREAAKSPLERLFVALAYVCTCSMWICYNSSSLPAGNLAGKEVLTMEVMLFLNLNESLLAPLAVGLIVACFEWWLSKHK